MGIDLELYISTVQVDLLPSMRSADGGAHGHDPKPVSTSFQHPAHCHSSMDSSAETPFLHSKKRI